MAWYIYIYIIFKTYAACSMLKRRNCTLNCLGLIIRRYPFCLFLSFTAWLFVASFSESLYPIMEAYIFGNWLYIYCKLICMSVNYLLSFCPQKRVASDTYRSVVCAKFVRYVLNEKPVSRTVLVRNDVLGGALTATVVLYPPAHSNIVNVVTSHECKIF